MTITKEEALINSSFKAMLDNTQDMIFVKDANLVYVAASMPFARMVGKLSVDEIVGHTDGEIFSDSVLAQRYVEDDKKLMKSGRDLLDYLEPITEDGGKARYGSTSKYLLRDKDGEIIGGIELQDIAGQMDSMDLDAYAELALSVTKTAYDRDYDYMAESSSDCHAMVSLISHDGKEFYHYFFKGTEIGYDLWIDNNVLDARDMRSYLKTLHSDDIYNPQDHMTTNAEVPLLNLRVTLPDGITYQPVRTTRSLFYSGETVVGGVEQIDVSADLDALGTAATTLMQELYGGDFDYISMDLESENIIASIATQQGDSRFVHYIITVGTECYDVWADPMLIMEEDLLEITYSCKY